MQALASSPLSGHGYALQNATEAQTFSYLSSSFLAQILTLCIWNVYHPPHRGAMIATFSLALSPLDFRGGWSVEDVRLREINLCDYLLTAKPSEFTKWPLNCVFRLGKVRVT